MKSTPIVKKMVMPRRKLGRSARHKEIMAAAIENGKWMTSDEYRQSSREIWKDYKPLNIIS